MKKFLIIFFVVLAEVCAGQQSITWNRIYDGPLHYNDAGLSICSSTNGTYFVFGSTYTSGIGGVFILKINEFGDTLWTKVFTKIYDVKTSLSTDDGGCIFAGRKDTSKLIKLDQNGQEVWVKNYLPQMVSIYCIKKTLNGYICCGTRSNSADGYILRIKFDGSLIWEKIYPASLIKGLFSIEDSYEGGYLISGVSTDLKSDTTKALLMKIDTSGNFKWEKKYKVKNMGSSGGFISKINNGYIMMGSTLENNNNNISRYRVYMMRLDKTGDSLFTKRFFSSYRDRDDQYAGSNVINGNRFIITTLMSPYPYLGKVIIFDSIGSIIQQKIYTSQPYLYYNYCLPLENGDIMLTGTIKNYPVSFYENLILTRTDSILNAPIININNLNTTIPKEFYLYQNYPNPFNPVTKINYSILTSEYTFLKVCDALGKEVTVLVNERQNAGSYSVKFDGSNLPSGIYFYILESGEFRDVKRMILIK